jgi:Zn-dependent protease with chaperone function
MEPVEHGPDAEKVLFERFAALAEANGLAPPPIEVADDPRGRLMPARVDWSEDDDRVVVSSTLLTARPDEQIWELAACLGWWTSPGPRRRRNRDRVAAGFVVAAYLGVGFAEVVGAIHLPKPGLFLLTAAATALVTATLNLVSRRQVAALDAAGRQVLRAAGHDPATLARLAFGGRADPPWYRRPLSRVPAPSRRLASAGVLDVSPAPSLH